MHARFNFEPKSSQWDNYYNYGLLSYTKNKLAVEADLKKLQDENKNLLAEEIIAKWFPSITAEVFLSHSHKDERLVIGIAGWLKQNFGLTSFIDSTVWGYAGELQKLIDNTYSRNTNGSYNYEAVTRTASHVHMMLSTALTNMIDQCECIIFINTPRSFYNKDQLSGKGVSESPWLYSEIEMTRMLQQKTPQEHRQRLLLDSTTASAERHKDTLRVTYPMDLHHLTNLTENDLEKWEAQQNFKNKGASSLDSLYKMKSNSKSFYG